MNKFLSDVLAAYPEPFLKFQLPKEEAFSDRDFEELAIMMAERSTFEQEDAKLLFGKAVPQPRVGAVLVNGLSVYCSARSGIELGDHAEFTDLETLAHGDDLNNATLYTTLEPCTSESRHPWTKSCSQLIVDRKIKKVFYGTIDANHLVTGQGIKYLFDHNVFVSSFDSGFLSKLKELNKEFFGFYEGKQDSKALRKADLFLDKLIDWEAVAYYQDPEDKKKPIVDADLKTEFYRRMFEMGENEEGDEFHQVAVSQALALMFFNNPSIKIPGFRITINNSRQKTKDDSGSLSPRRILNKCLIRIMAPKFWDENNLFYNLLKTLCPLFNGEDPLLEKELTRMMDEAFPNKTGARELVFNSLIHNDYSQCSNITIGIDDKVLIIQNFAEISDDDVEQMNNGLMASIPTNPRLMDFVETCKLAEQNAIGMRNIALNNKSLSSIKNSHGLPVRTYKLEKCKNKKTLITIIPHKNIAY